MIRTFLAKRIGVPIAEKIRGWPVSHLLSELEESQWLTPQQIREVQDRKLAALVDHAYSTVPFYRQMFDKRGLKPENVRSVDDLAKLPIVTKEVIKDNMDQIVSDRFDRSELVLLGSSGSTGEPFMLYISDEEKALKWAGLLRFWKWAGFELGDRYVNVTGFPHGAFKGKGLWRFLEQSFSGMLALNALELVEGDADQYARRIAAFRPKMLRGYSSSLHYLAQIFRNVGAKLSVGCACTTGETLFPFQRELMESCFGCKVYDGYGGEAMEVAGQCGFGNTYHVNAESIIVEIVDADGNRCQPNQAGQVVLTDLNHYSMPFIRYNIQDVAAASDRRCECGRGLPVIEDISGRLTDVGVTPSGKSLIVHFFTGLFENYAAEVEAFQAVQETADHLVLTIVPGKGLDQVEDQILRRTQDYVGQDVHVEIRRQDSIALGPGGKRRLFISRSGVKAAGYQTHG